MRRDRHLRQVLWPLRRHRARTGGEDDHIEKLAGCLPEAPASILKWMDAVDTGSKQQVRSFTAQYRPESSAGTIRPPYVILEPQLCDPIRAVAKPGGSDEECP